MSQGAPPPGGNLPARRLSSAELEAVIRRAVELQSASGPIDDDGIPEAEVLRIGKELGLEPATVRRAIADVRGKPPEERGVMAGVMGPREVRAARTIRRPAAQLGLFLEQYLLKCEHMLVLRRFPDRTRYVRGTGVAAALGRAAQKLGTRQTLLDLPRVDVAVSALDEDTSLVEVSTDLGGARAGFAATGFVAGGGAAAAISAFALVTPAADLIALLGAPALGGTMAWTRWAFGAVSRSTHEKLEAFLDRLEHGELKLPPQKPDWRKQLGI
ncbi:MAG TPA: hypothetical protein VHG28_13950 [Longimicrobiaceae bacterium]|nr:hypothetical protein [Longimicrobiaceae bacterium]